jgi:hypothetical protein
MAPYKEKRKSATLYLSQRQAMADAIRSVVMRHHLYSCDQWLCENQDDLMELADNISEAIPSRGDFRALRAIWETLPARVRDLLVEVEPKFLLIQTAE